MTTTTVSSGQTVSGAFIGPADTEIVLAGGSSADPTVAGGTVILKGGTLFGGGSVTSGGTVVVSAGGVVQGGMTVDNASAVVSSGGLFYMGTFGSGSVLSVSAGGSASFDIIGGGASLTVASGGMASGNTVSSGGTMTVSNGGSVLGGSIVGTFIAQSGADVTSLGVRRGGTAEVESGAYVVSGTVDAGAVMTVSQGGSVTGVRVLGTLDLDGSASELTAGQAQIVVSSHGSVANSYIGNGVISSGGQVQETTVRGTLQVLRGAVASDTTVIAYGNLDVSGGKSFGTTLHANARVNAIETVESGGIASGTSVGLASRQYVSQGGIASGTFLSGTNARQLVTGGVAVGTDAIFGSQTIYSGKASGTIIGSRGVQEVLGGVAVGTIVSQGGLERIARGVASATTIKSGGIATVLSGAMASATIVSSGGQLVVGSGGAAKNVTLNGGTEVVQNGGEMDQTIRFGAHGTLSIAKPVSAPHVAKFGATDRIILTAFAFNGALKHAFVENAAKTQGVLKITEGAKTASITLFGQYVAAGFHFTKAGAGTVITYTPPPAAHAELAAAHT